MDEISAKAPHDPQNSSFTRRMFLGTALGGGAAILAGGASVFVGTTSQAEAGADSMFKLGGDLSVNRLGFGASRIARGGVAGQPKDRDEAIRVLKRAVALGVTLIDTADVYGPETSELLIAEALHPYPKGLVIATKGGLTWGPGQGGPNGDPEYLTQCVNKSLKRLRLERIDLYQLHRVDPKVPMEESLGALKKMQEAGKIRHVGLSEVGPEEISRAQKILPIATVQNQYNVANRKWEEALKYCEKENLGFMPWSPVGGGKSLKTEAMEAVAKEQNASVYQVAIAWLLQRSPVMLPIPGTSSVAHLEENVAAGKLKLTPAQLKAMDAG